MKANLITKGICFCTFFLCVFIKSDGITKVKPEYFYPSIQVSDTSLAELISYYLFSSEIMNQSEIQRLPIHTSSGVFQFVPGIQSQSRGNGDVQMDLSLRGSSFEQVSIYVDGMLVNDPQTGHHHADIPIISSSIEHIEVITGPAAAVFGASNIGGIIHIYTQKPHETKTQATFSFGKHNTSTIQLGQSFRTKSIHHQIQFQSDHSDGYRYDSDYNNQTITYSNYIPLNNHEIRGYWGYSKKDFGANDFYADFHSYEKTQSFVGHLKGEFTLSDKLQLTSNIYHRWHDDDFILDFKNPEFYAARHKTHSTGFNLKGFYHLSHETIFTLGTELRNESINSRQLGNHDYTYFSLLSEMVHRFASKWMIHSGVKSIHLNNHGHINPSFQLGYQCNQNITLRLSSGKVFRIPSFTEKYYNSPANVGDPDLESESGWIHDFGISLQFSNIKLEPTFFVRQENNRIEWIRSDTEDPWISTNFDHSSVMGYEIHLSSSAYPIHFRCSVTRLFNESVNYKNRMTKYPFNTLNFYFYSSLFWNLPYDFKQSLMIKHNNYKDRDPYTVVDTRILKKINQWIVYTEFTNIFNVRYEEIIGLPMPGFNWMFGIQYQTKH